LDVYPSLPDHMVVWIITENDERVRLVDKFTCKIYASGNFEDLRCLAEIIGENKSLTACRFVEKQADLMKAYKDKVLEIDIGDYRRTHFFARKLLRLAGYEKFRLHNIDIKPSEAYLYEKNIFPLARLVVVDSGDRLWYEILDSSESVDYATPPLRSAWLDVDIDSTGPLQKLSDKIDSISLQLDNEKVVINDGNETNKILELVKIVNEEDPDIIYTQGGDSFLIPYLAYRASANGILSQFFLSREKIPLTMKKNRGRTLFSYGRAYRTSAARRLYGRIHIDVGNTFIHNSCGLEGLIEVSRTCKVPLHKAARATIGNIMSSLQLYAAWKDNVLIPWKKQEPESFKSASELIIADRGGFVFEPKLGFHTDVIEVDFASMFPTLMLTRNISAETVCCGCCPDSKLIVPELGYNICEKRRGIVPKTLDLLLKKRMKYKSLMKEACEEKPRSIYNARQAALKWILVTCFGYLGYRNARFGKVEAHITVCAFSRDILLKAAKMAEEYGFEVIHGIVDSLWIKKHSASSKEVISLCNKISKEVGITLCLEGVYRWIVFPPSKVLDGVPVLNRYYGVYENGEIKIRGIEARRRDTPQFIREAQLEMIRKLSEAFTLESFEAKIPEVLRHLRICAEKLINREIDICDLLIKKRLSKSPSAYNHKIFQAMAAKQLEKAGFEIYAGQSVQYLIVNSKSRRAEERVLAAKLLKPNTEYDVEEYLKMLISAAETLLGVFGYDKERIRAQVLHHEKQITLI
jgi:DNA polymerase I